MTTPATYRRDVDPVLECTYMKLSVQCEGLKSFLQKAITIFQSQGRELIVTDTDGQSVCLGLEIENMEKALKNLQARISQMGTIPTEEDSKELKQCTQIFQTVARRVHRIANALCKDTRKVEEVEKEIQQRSIHAAANLSRVAAPEFQNPNNRRWDWEEVRLGGGTAQGQDIKCRDRLNTILDGNLRDAVHEMKEAYGCDREFVLLLRELQPNICPDLQYAAVAGDQHFFPNLCEAFLARILYSSMLELGSDSEDPLQWPQNRDGWLTLCAGVLFDRQDQNIVQYQKQFNKHFFKQMSRISPEIARGFPWGRVKTFLKAALLMAGLIAAEKGRYTLSVDYKQNLTSTPNHPLLREHLSQIRIPCRGYGVRDNLDDLEAEDLEEFDKHRIGFVVCPAVYAGITGVPVAKDLFRPGTIYSYIPYFYSPRIGRTKF